MPSPAPASSNSHCCRLHGSSLHNILLSPGFPVNAVHRDLPGVGPSVGSDLPAIWRGLRHGRFRDRYLQRAPGTTTCIDQADDTAQARFSTGTTDTQLKRKAFRLIKHETTTSAASQSNMPVSGASSFRLAHAPSSSWHMAGRSSKGQ